MLLLLENGDQKWLDVIERQIAEIGVAIAISRNEAIQYLNKAILEIQSSFIKTKVKIIGEIEREAQNKTSIQLEEFFLHKLNNNRNLDAKSKRNLFGVHRSDFTANLLSKNNLSANLCSTGEQKSILIALTIARARINNFFKLPKAIMLLDEVVSHLDEKNKIELFKELKNINVQSFLTGTGEEIFSYFKDLKSGNVKFIQVS
jgi:DNA replication and repair protein RecF